MIIPYFKGNYFGELLESLARQTDKRFAAYIGNDNSSQDPSALINRFDTALVIRYHSFADRLGDKDLAGQWNRCLQLMQGEDWVWVLPDDDLPSENCVAEFYRALDETGGTSINAFHLPLAVLRSDGKVQDFYAQVPERESNLDFYQRHLRGEGGGSTLGNVIYRGSKLIEKRGFVSFPKGWGSDHATLLRVASGGEIFHLRNARLTFRMSDQNVSSFRGDGAEKMRARLTFLGWLKENEGMFPQQPDITFYKNFYFKGEHYFLYEWDISLRAFIDLWRLRWRCVYRPETLSMAKLLLRRVLGSRPAA